jgi:hypothetical protein
MTVVTVLPSGTLESQKAVRGQRSRNAMTRSRLVRVGVLVVVAMVSAVWFVGAATARLTAQTTPVAATPGVPATLAGQDASQSLVGDALPLLPPGRPGVVDIITVGVPINYDVPIVLRNNTGEAVLLTSIHGTAHEATGALIATGEAGSFISPSVVRAGQVAIAWVYFNSRDNLPPDAVLAFEPETESLATATVFRQDLEIVEVAPGEQNITGLVQNGTEVPLAGTVNVLGICFDATGAITGSYLTYADKNDLDPDETASFNIELEGTGPCDAFLLGANSSKKL